MFLLRSIHFLLALMSTSLLLVDANPLSNPSYQESGMRGLFFLWFGSQIEQARGTKCRSSLEDECPSPFEWVVH